MPLIKIDGQDYDLESLPEAAKSHLQCLQYVDAELIRLDQQAAVLKTARAGYFSALKKILAEPAEPAPNFAILAGDTIKFD